MLDPQYYDILSQQMSKACADQLSVWPLARANFRQLKTSAVREINLDGFTAKLVNIPSRAISTKADTSAESLSRRPCFLCSKNRPVEQRVTFFEGAKGKRYNIQVNPFPILPEHFVIPSLEHTPQSIWRRYVDMLRLAKRRPGYTILYNGPKCGASAPDHFHFQAVPSGILPLEISVAGGEHLEYITSVREAELYAYRSFTTGIFVLKAATSKSMNRLFYRLLDCADVQAGDTEPRFNLITFRQDGRYVSVVIFRSRHRSDNYGNPDPSRCLTMSPGCVDMCGYFVTILKTDFAKMTPELLRELVSGVSISKDENERIVNRLTRPQRKLEICLGTFPELYFEVCSDGAGVRKAVCRNGRIEYGGAEYDELYFGERTLSKMFAETSFILHDSDSVRRYPGALRLTVREGKIQVCNIVGLEDCVHAVLTKPDSLLPELFASDPAAGASVSNLQKTGDKLKSMAIAIRSELLNNPVSNVYSGLGDADSPEVKSAVDSSWGIML